MEDGGGCRSRREHLHSAGCKYRMISGCADRLLRQRRESDRCAADPHDQHGTDRRHHRCLRGDADRASSPAAPPSAIAPSMLPRGADPATTSKQPRTMAASTARCARAACDLARAASIAPPTRPAASVAATRPNAVGPAPSAPRTRKTSTTFVTFAHEDERAQPAAARAAIGPQRIGRVGRTSRSAGDRIVSAATGVDHGTGDSEHDERGRVDQQWRAVSDQSHCETGHGRRGNGNGGGHRL
jgi:hypothetical protein